MADAEMIAKARALPERAPTDKELATILALADAAVEQADNVIDAGEMLVSAAALALVRHLGLRDAWTVLAQLAAVQEVAFRDNLQ